MMDLKNYSGVLVQKINPRGWWYWVKHHIVSLSIILAGVVFVVWFVGSKMVYVMVDQNQKVERTFVPGIKILMTVTIPDPIYNMSQPYSAQIMCADGEKFLVLGGFAATKMEGECE